nr:peptidoglycan DD-metalloendopeptidase family protein [Heyndrickxia oleronia]
MKKSPIKKRLSRILLCTKEIKRVKQKGKNGKSELTYIIIEENGKQVKKDINEEKVLKKPVNHIVIVGTKVTPSRGSGDFAWPTNGGYISSQLGQRWGSMHKGIDIARPSNRTIKAADNGRVVFAGWDGGYGNKIIIDHNNGFRTVYAHLSSINVSAGEIVPKGSAIGVMGATGDATGIHLHFEVYKDGNLMNPLSYL